MSHTASPSEKLQRLEQLVVPERSAVRLVIGRGFSIALADPRVFPFQVLLSAADCGLTADSKAQAEQVRAVGADRLRGRIGAVPTPSLRQIDEAIRLHLSL